MSDELRRLANRRFKRNNISFSQNNNSNEKKYKETVSKRISPNENGLSKSKTKENSNAEETNNIDKVLSIMNGTYVSEKSLKNLEFKRKHLISEILNSLSNFSDYQLEKLILSSKKELDLKNSNFILEFFSAFDSLESLDYEIRVIQNNRTNFIDLKSERKKLKKLDFNDLCLLMDVDPDLAFSKGFLIDSRINQLNDYHYRKNSIFKKDINPNLIDSIYDIYYGAYENVSKKPLKTSSNMKNKFNKSESKDIISKIDNKFASYLYDKHMINFLEKNIAYTGFVTISLSKSYFKTLKKKGLKARDGRLIIKRVLYECIENDRMDYENLKREYTNNFSKYQSKFKKLDYNRENNIIKSFLEYKKLLKEHNNFSIKKEIKSFDIENNNDGYLSIEDMGYKEVQDNFEFKLGSEQLDELNKFIDGNIIKIRSFNKNFLSNDKYIGKSLRDSFIKGFEKIYDYLSKFDFNSIRNFNQINCDLGLLVDFKNNYESLLNYKNLQDENENSIKEINENYVKNEIEKNNAFFEKIKITDLAKKRAIVIDEDNIKVIAGAGTGKTFTLQAKVKYLIEKKGISPEKILCLCYTSKGASELDDKVNSLLDESNKVEVCTFHEFCRRVDRYCGNIKTTNRYLLDNIIRNYMKLTLDDSVKIDKLMDYFSYYMLPPTDKEKFDSLKELEEYERGKDLSTLKSKYDKRNGEIKETLKGDFVNSIEELIIANYLFMHEIEYEYEGTFPYNYFADFIEKNFLYSGHFLCMNNINEITDQTTLSNELLVKKFIDWERRRKAYQPDFYLPEKDIYLEHFGVDKDMKNHWLKGDEKLKYEQEMYSKQLWHGMYQTNLIETYSFFMKEGRLLECLEELLRKKGVTIGQRDKKEMLEILLTIDKINDYKNFMKLIKDFINIFEAKYYPKNKFAEFKSSNKYIENGYVKKRQELFFDIVEDIYDKYYQYNQTDDIDHNREISNALELIESGEYDKKYDYILIDEYQDINFVRCKLLQALQKSAGAKIFAVGDDWQSIYKFNGSDVSLFIDFEKYFPGSETIKIEKSRRNPTKINSISTKFILKNKKQQKKELRYYKKIENVNQDPLKIVRYPTKNENYKILKLEAILADIKKKSKKENPKILILGRANDDINSFVNNNIFLVKDYDKFKKIIYTENKNLDITFMTVHKAKGLEFDEVVVINLVNKINGFPIQIEDDPLLDFVKTKDSCLYAEERRLFYVALTRSRNNVYLLTPRMGYSTFITELTKDFDILSLPLKNLREKDYDIYDDNPYFKRIEKYPSSKVCPKCGMGEIVIIVNNEKGTKFVRCSECDYDGGPYPSRLDDIKYIEPCPSCRGILVRQGDILRCSLNYHEGCRETKEVKLDKEDLDDEL